MIEDPDRAPGLRVTLADPDPRWAEMYAAEESEIRAALGGLLLRIEHVGSTAVPRLAAKPIIDIAVEVPSLDAAVGSVGALAAIGFAYVPVYEQEVPNRRYFRKGEVPGHRTHHLHVYGASDPDFDDFLRFRDYLRAHAEVAREYEVLKRDLASRLDRAGYTPGKAPFIRAVIERARAAGY